MKRLNHFIRNLNSRTKDIIAYCIFGISVLIIALSISLSVKYIYSIATNSNTNQDEKILYILREHDGKIAIFNQEDNKLIFETDIWIESLPELDKAMLQQGLVVKNDGELKQLLEDFE